MAASEYVRQTLLEHDHKRSLAVLPLILPLVSQVRATKPVFAASNLEVQ